MGGAGGAVANAAGLNWCDTQPSNSAGVTTNVRKRMFACDAPQYSLQLPLKTVVLSDVSGVNQR